MTFGNYQTLRFTRRARVLEIAIDTGGSNRPNVVTRQLHEEMASVWDEVSNDPDSDILVLTGAGPSFCAGGDLEWLSGEVRDGLTPFVDEVRTAKRIVQSLLDCPKPIVAKVNGDAIGFGATVALLCDVVFAAKGVRFSDPHVRIGLAAGDGGALIWPQLIGFGKARHFLLTGDAVEADEAERMGLIGFAVDPEALDASVDAYTDKLARGAQTAIRYTKATLNLSLRQTLPSVFEAGLAYEGLTRHTADHREGVTAFIEKRRPVFGSD